jgi:hypothetical protein
MPTYAEAIAVTLMEAKVVAMAVLQGGQGQHR